MSRAGRHYAGAALLAALFTAYVSWMPFRFEPPADLVEAVRGAAARLRFHSGTDFGQNVLLGVPLGFSALGALAGGARRGWLFAPLAVAAAAAWGAAVEFGQLFVPGRVGSAMDVIAQAAGGAVGALAWLLAGPPLTARLAAAWRHPAVGGPPGRRLLTYIAFLTVVQLLPLDFDVSPWTLGKRVLREEWAKVPFAELTGVGGAATARPWRKPADWAQQLIVFAPVGVLLAWRPRWGAARCAAAGLALATLLEAAQFTVQSRSPSATDALLGAAAVVLGRCVRGPAAFALVAAAVLAFVLPFHPTDLSGWERGVGGIPGTAAQALATVIVAFALPPTRRTGVAALAAGAALLAGAAGWFPLPALFAATALAGAVAGDSVRRRLTGEAS